MMQYFNNNILLSKLISGLILVSIVASFFSPIAGSAIPVAEAAFNQQINYQGKLTNGSNVAVADGTYNMEFKLYTSLSGGSPVWTETLTGSNKVQVTNGLFSVMLGSTTAFTGVDFNQTLYLGVNIGGTGTPSWDGEMSPRKILGAVPAAFEAQNAQNLQGLNPTQFVRTDAANATSTTSTFLTITQSGTGKVAEFIGQSSMPSLTVLSNGSVGVGTSTPFSRFAVGGSAYIGGNLTATGTLNVSGATTLASLSATSLSVGSLSGLLFGTNGTVSAVSTSTLGIALSDTTGILAVARGGTGISTAPSYGQLLLGNSSGGYDLVATSSLGITSQWTTSGSNIYYNTGNVGIGTTSPYAKLSVNGAVAGTTFTGSSFNATTTDGYQMFGQTLLSTAGEYNVFLGGAGNYGTTGSDNFFAGANVGASNSTGSGNFFAGSYTGMNNTTGNGNIFVGYSNGTANTSGSENILLGSYAGGANSTGSGVIAIGYSALENTTAGSSTALGYKAGYANTSGTLNTFLGYGTNASSGGLTNATAIGANAVVSASNSMVLGSGVHVGIGTSSPFSKLSVGGSAYIGGNLTATGTITFSALSNGCVEVSSGVLTSTGTNCGTGSGGITSLAGLTASSQTFATSSDANITLSIVSSGSTHTFTPAWSGVLSIARGGTGTSTAPSYGQVLLGNAAGGYDLVATSSLGITAGSSLTGSAGQVAYFSGANTAVGTSSLYISTNGNVGINTTGPDSV